MSERLIHLLFGSIIGLLAWAIPYVLVNTPIASTLSTVIANYCGQPQEDRQALQVAIASMLVKGDSLEIHCVGDIPLKPPPKRKPLIVNGEML